MQRFCFALLYILFVSLLIGGIVMFYQLWCRILLTCMSTTKHTCLYCLVFSENINSRICFLMHLVSLDYCDASGVAWLLGCKWCRLTIVMQVVSLDYCDARTVAWLLWCMWCRLTIVMQVVSLDRCDACGVAWPLWCMWCRFTIVCASSVRPAWFNTAHSKCTQLCPVDNW